MGINNKRTILISVTKEDWQRFKALAMLRGNSAKGEIENYINNQIERCSKQLDSLKDLYPEGKENDRESNQVDLVNETGEDYTPIKGTGVNNEPFKDNPTYEKDIQDALDSASVKFEESSPESKGKSVKEIPGQDTKDLILSDDDVEKIEGAGIIGDLPKPEDY